MQAPLCVEGWDEALHEIGRLSFSTVLSPQNAAALLKSVQDLPVLMVAGAEDALVSLKTAQAVASGFENSVSAAFPPPPAHQPARPLISAHGYGCPVAEAGGDLRVRPPPPRGVPQGPPGGPLAIHHQAGQLRAA